MRGEQDQSGLWEKDWKEEKQSEISYITLVLVLDYVQNRI